jgi:hypothetical protein
MNNDFQATHVIVATSYEEADKYGLGVGAEVALETPDGDYWENSQGYVVSKEQATVEPIKPASAFTEAQLRELEGLYGLVASSDALPAARVVASVTEPVKSYYVLSRGEQPVGLFFTPEEATIAAEDVCDPYLDVFNEKGLHLRTLKWFKGGWTADF